MRKPQGEKRVRPFASSGYGTMQTQNMQKVPPLPSSPPTCRKLLSTYMLCSVQRMMCQAGRSRWEMIRRTPHLRRRHVRTKNVPKVPPSALLLAESCCTCRVNVLVFDAADAADVLTCPRGRLITYGGCRQYATLDS